MHFSVVLDRARLIGVSLVEGLSQFASHIRVNANETSIPMLQ